MNWAGEQLGLGKKRMFDDTGKWIGWENSAGDLVYWGHGDWGNGKGLSNFPHLNFNIKGQKGHLFLKNKIQIRGEWTAFSNEILKLAD